MRTGTCDHCHKDFTYSPRGRKRKYCSALCCRESYRRPCMDCGTLMTGAEGTGPNAPKRCTPCSKSANGKARKVWTSEAIIDAVRSFAAEFGDPPAVPDWNPWTARHELHDEDRARRFEERCGGWPNFTTVIREFGTWSAAIEAAGFDARPAHGGGGNGARHRERQEWVQRREALAALWTAGLSVAEIAEQLGCAPSNVRTRVSKLRRRGYDLPYRNRPPNPATDRRFKVAA